MTIRECLFLKFCTLTLSSVVLQSLDLNKICFCAIVFSVPVCQFYSCKCHLGTLSTYLSSLARQMHSGLSSDELYSPSSQCPMSSISSRVLFPRAHIMISGLLLAVFLLISRSKPYLLVILSRLVLLLMLMVANSLSAPSTYMVMY